MSLDTGRERKPVAFASFSSPLFFKTPWEGQEKPNKIILTEGILRKAKKCTKNQLPVAPKHKCVYFVNMGVICHCSELSNCDWLMRPINFACFSSLLSLYPSPLLSLETFIWRTKMAQQKLFPKWFQVILSKNKLSKMLSVSIFLSMNMVFYFLSLDVVCHGVSSATGKDLRDMLPLHISLLFYLFK